MIIATRFRALGWVAGVAAAALFCYLISLQVAVERGQLMKLERRILGARADIRQLRTELDTRGRLVQLERWNAEVLGLQAPKASQYAHGEVQLAGYVQPKAAPVVIQVAAPVLQAPQIPQVVTASYGAPVAAARPERSRSTLPNEPAGSRPLKAQTVAAPTAQPLVRHATYIAPVAAPAVLPAAVRRPASRTALLGDDLLGEIGRSAAVEAKK